MDEEEGDPRPPPGGVEGLVVDDFKISLGQCALQTDLNCGIDATANAIELMRGCAPPSELDGNAKRLEYAAEISQGC